MAKVTKKTLEKWQRQAVGKWNRDRGYDVQQREFEADPFDKHKPPAPKPDAWCEELPNGEWIVAVRTLGREGEVTAYTMRSMPKTIITKQPIEIAPPPEIVTEAKRRDEMAKVMFGE
jgi:hypothetical protein